MKKDFHPQSLLYHIFNMVRNNDPIPFNHLIFMTLFNSNPNKVVLLTPHHHLVFDFFNDFEDEHTDPYNHFRRLHLIILFLE